LEEASAFSQGNTLEEASAFLRHPFLSPQLSSSYHNIHLISLLIIILFMYVAQGEGEGWVEPNKTIEPKKRDLFLCGQAVHFVLTNGDLRQRE
jgi:hypothetical protein